jgi:hypothetical protein
MPYSYEEFNRTYTPQRLAEETVSAQKITDSQNSKGVFSGRIQIICMVSCMFKRTIK